MHNAVIYRHANAAVILPYIIENAHKDVNSPAAVRRAAQLLTHAVASLAGDVKTPHQHHDLLEWELWGALACRLKLSRNL